MGALLEGVQHVADTLTAADLATIVDPRKLRPGVVLVEPPSIVGISAGTTEMTVPVSVVASTVGDAAAIFRMLDTVDTITALFPVLSGEPGIYATGNQELPSYRLTVRVTVRR